MTALLSLLAATPALAQTPWEVAKDAAGSAMTSKLETAINKRLLSESRKNQCSFKVGTDRLAPGCDRKMKRLARALIAAEKDLSAAGIKSFKFEASGHTDRTGSAARNKELSNQRAEVVVKQLVANGVSRDAITAVGWGSERPRVSPEDTAAKRATNRRYELRLRL